MAVSIVITIINYLLNIVIIMVLHFRTPMYCINNLKKLARRRTDLFQTDGLPQCWKFSDQSPQMEPNTPTNIISSHTMNKQNCLSQNYPIQLSMSKDSEYLSGSMDQKNKLWWAVGDSGWDTVWFYSIDVKVEGASRSKHHIYILPRNH